MSDVTSTCLSLGDEADLRWFLTYAAGDLSSLRSGLGPQIERMRAAGGRNRGSKPVPAFGGNGGGQGVDLTKHLLEGISKARRLERILAGIDRVHHRTLAAAYGPGLAHDALAAWGWLPVEGLPPNVEPLPTALLLITAERLRISRGEMRGWRVGTRDSAKVKGRRRRVQATGRCAHARGAAAGVTCHASLGSAESCCARAWGAACHVDLDCHARAWGVTCRAGMGPSPSLAPAPPPSPPAPLDGADPPEGESGAQPPQPPAPPGDCPASPAPQALRPLSYAGRTAALKRLREEADVALIVACLAFNEEAERLREVAAAERTRLIEAGLLQDDPFHLDDDSDGEGSAGELLRLLLGDGCEPGATT